MFAIEFQSGQESETGNGASVEAPGRIVIGDFTETFRIPLGFWGESDYRRSWRQAFEALEDSSHSVSCLMTSMTDPRNSNFLTCWPMYREGDDVYIQNAIIFLDEIGEDFNLAAPWSYVKARQRTDEDGNKVSEWATTMDSLAEFFG